jgi:hypothetical protein
MSPIEGRIATGAVESNISVSLQYICYLSLVNAYWAAGRETNEPFDCFA